nr:proline-rich protein 36-like [Aegilops tauschii subsp. strangulata]
MAPVPSCRLHLDGLAPPRASTAASPCCGSPPHPALIARFGDASLFREPAPALAGLACLEAASPLAGLAAPWAGSACSPRVGPSRPPPPPRAAAPAPGRCSAPCRLQLPRPASSARRDAATRRLLRLSPRPRRFQTLAGDKKYTTRPCVRALPPEPRSAPCLCSPRVPPRPRRLPLRWPASAPAAAASRSSGSPPPPGPHPQLPRRLVGWPAPAACRPGRLYRAPRASASGQALLGVGSRSARLAPHLSARVRRLCTAPATSPPTHHGAGPVALRLLCPGAAHPAASLLDGSDELAGFAELAPSSPLRAPAPLRRCAAPPSGRPARVHDPDRARGRLPARAGCWLRPVAYRPRRLRLRPGRLPSTATPVLATAPPLPGRLARPPAPAGRLRLATAALPR